ncbi:MAG: paraslipin [Deltaproteobacteria bacterium]|nr:paraslipin [Deltaproteobacteria bacterium]
MGLYYVVTAIIWTCLALYTSYKVIRSVRLVPNRTELIVERLGRYHETLGPGLHVLLPFFDRVAFMIDMKEEAIDVPPQDCFTKDNVRVEVDGILYLRVANAKQASYGITNYHFAAIQLAQTTTRAVIGTLELDRTFEERDIINAHVIKALNEVSAAWGIQVMRYEVKNIVPPASVKNAMERQMGAERERRALLARAEGDRAARINDSEGKKQEMINRSEGEMQRRVNEAQGKAQEILALAQATADSIRTVGQAVTADGGAEAVNLKISQQYVQKLGALANGAQVVVPADLLRVDDVLGSMGVTLATSSRVPAARATVPVPQPIIAPPRERE